jgi:lysine 6-dehydrogenase
MGYRYVLLGAGKQGVAAAYDLAKHGRAEEVVLVDIDAGAAQRACEKINRLLAAAITTPVQADASRRQELDSVLKGADALISCVHYPYNPLITQAAIEARCNMCDLGGNTDVVREQMKMDSAAKKAGISVVPDCGMGPGMNIGLAVYAMSLVKNAREVYIWDGGLPQNPRPPWNYNLTFNIDGLSNEYYGSAYFIRDGRVTPVRCFEGYEEIEFPPPIGRLEAFVTSGGLSTAPWTFEGKLERLENKTLRFPGHWAQFSSFSELGLLEKEPVRAGSVDVVPRDLFHALLAPRITDDEVRDMGVMRVRCVGGTRDKPKGVTVELIDYYDEETGFTAMQKLTGWHASIVAILAAANETPRGVVPVELAVSGPRLVEEARKRGFNISERKF